MERAVVTVQFFILIKVFVEEITVFLRVHICSAIRKYTQRRCHLNMNMVRTSISVPLITHMNLLTQERCPTDATFMRRASVIA